MPRGTTPAPPTNFYPRPPRGGRPVDIRGIRAGGNFYPRPPRGGRLGGAKDSTDAVQISIHALREEGDVASRTMPAKPLAISIHALREEGDLQCLVTWSSHRYFYPRPPRGGRRVNRNSEYNFAQFLSTPSARRATTVFRDSSTITKISIHALREEGDANCPAFHLRCYDFYPRPPRGGRQQKQRQNLYFQTNYTTFCTNLEEP